ncbi:tetratricopeptide (TPR) repeat protein [Paraburkholderia sp. GAS448]|uniref:tetratricopeptide repeat protein n=1 Tax=Paraburkholderia sp. GAS448 TaxID=3035136 RepID=UPI003D1FC5EC
MPFLPANPDPGARRRRTLRRPSGKTSTSQGDGDLCARLTSWVKTAGSLILVIWLLLTVGMQLKPRTLVEPVAVPKSLAERGVTGEVVQQQLAARLNQVLSEADSEMPSQIRESIEADEPESSVQLLNTGISLDAVAYYTKRMFGINDVYIRGSLSPTASGVCEFAITISQGALEQSFAVTSSDNQMRCADVKDSTGPTAQNAASVEATTDRRDLVSLAADQVMEKRNPFVYAEALSNRDRIKCYEHGPQCDYRDAVDAFNGILNDVEASHYYKWSWLALSKIHEDRGEYASEVQSAMLSVAEDQTFAWGYYNWGIGLAELGCGEQALEAFLTAVKYRPATPAFAFAYNAAGRQALNLTLTDRALSRDDVIRLRNYATSYLMTATELQPDYAEAYVNLGDAIADLPDRASREEARDQYLTAILLQSQQVLRAVASMKAHEFEVPVHLAQGPSQSIIDVLRSNRTLPPVCRYDSFARALRDSNGCLSPAQPQIMRDKAQVSKAAARVEAGYGREDCRFVSVANNVGNLQPFVLNPVYSEAEPRSGSKPVLIWP